MKRYRLDLSARWRVLFAVPLLLLAAATAAAQARPATATIKVAGHALRVEVVSTPAERARGLMFREKLGRDDGMLFLFDEPAYHSMWMKDTLIPLSVAFVDANGTILSIHDMEPRSLDSHMSAGPSVYAIETNRGWFAERRLGPGARVAGLPPPPRR